MTSPQDGASDSQWQISIDGTNQPDTKRATCRLTKAVPSSIESYWDSRKKDPVVWGLTVTNVNSGQLYVEQQGELIFDYDQATMFTGLMSMTALGVAMLLF